MPTMPKRKMSDRQALDRIAAMLGSNTTWDSPADYLTDIANLIQDTGRLHPGDQPPDVLAYYRGEADRFGYAHDGDEDDEDLYDDDPDGPAPDADTPIDRPFTARPPAWSSTLIPVVPERTAPCPSCGHLLGEHAVELGCTNGWELDENGCPCPLTLALQHNPPHEKEVR